MYKKIAALFLALIVPFVALSLFLIEIPSATANFSQPDDVQVARITLTKTVGTDPAVCAATQSITLPVGGGDVYYCYRATNTGTVALTRHTLVDDHLGALLTNFPFTLSPGNSVYLTSTAEITTTTVNSAIWTASNPGPIDVAASSDTAEVIVPLPSPAVAFTKTVGTDPNLCAKTSNLTLPVGGGDVTYCYRVTNTGNIALTRHTLVDDHIGTILTGFPFTLQPGNSVFLTSTVQITATTVNSATWTAFNPGPVDVVQGTDSATASIDHKLYLPVIRRD